MAIHYLTEDLPEFDNAVVTIGTFDGVHAGHQVILNQVVAHAKEQNSSSVLVTFHPHPRKLIFPNEPIHVLTPLEEKLELITKTGIEHILVVPFTKEFANLTAEEYVSEFLVSKINPQTIIIGYDHHFGNDRKGNIALLNQLKTKHGFEVVEIKAQLIKDAAISSTKIRNAIKEGEVSIARQMLSRHYSLKGTVIKGKQLGRTLGYPTANIKPNDAEQILPSNGAYAIIATYAKNKYQGMLNIGYRPTVSNERSIQIEANLFNFDKDIYNEELTVEFVQQIRPEMKFDSIDGLKEQLAKDKENVLELLSGVV